MNKMTFEEFIKFRDVKIKDLTHQKIINLFYPYLQSVSKDERLLPDIVGKLIDLDTSVLTIPSACFNNESDVDFSILLSNNIKIYVYGKIVEQLPRVDYNEYAIFILNDSLDGKKQKNNNYIFIY